jgi:hypothetical protein
MKCYYIENDLQEPDCCCQCPRNGNECQGKMNTCFECEGGESIEELHRKQEQWLQSQGKV